VKTASSRDAWAKTCFVAGSVFLLAMGFFLVKIARDALFVQGRGLFDLPRAYLGIAVLAGPTAGVVLALMRNLGPRLTRLVLAALVSSALIVFSFFIRPGGGLLMTDFFVFVPLVWGVLYSMSWLLAGELLDGVSPRQVAESYGLIGGAAILGGLLGGLVAKVLANNLRPNQVLWLAAGTVAASGVILGWAQRRWRPQMAQPAAAARQTMARGMAAVVASPFGRLLLAAGMAAGLVGVLLEFQFYLVAAAGADVGRNSTDFFANIYIVLNGAALVLQLLVLPRLHRWIGVGGSLLVLPVVLSGGVGALVAGVTVLGISSLRIAEGLAAGVLYLWLLRYAIVADAVAAGGSRMLILLFVCSLVWLLLSWVLRRGIHARLVAAGDPARLQYDVPLPDG